MRTLDFAPMGEADLDWVCARETELHAHPWTRGNFVDSLAGGHDAWILNCDGARAGYAVVLHVLDESHLLDIGIVPAMQHGGLGGDFLAWLAAGARARGSTSFFLEVRSSNAAALRLYERCGFAEIGRRRGYYPAHAGREDAIVMRRAL